MASIFEKEAGAALMEVGSSLQGVLTQLPKPVRKAADLRKVLGIDNNLSWQIYSFANDRNALRAAPLLPGEAAMRKFLEAAVAGGASSASVKSASEAYDRFQAVVERHAGDRTSFNSMVTAVSGVEEDEAVDLQHRRSMFRAASHLTGIQAKAFVSCTVIHEGKDGWDFGGFGGYVGLRTLRPQREVQVFTVGASLNHKILDDGFADGHLIKDFSTKPLPALSKREANGMLSYAIDRPELGNLGTSTLMFGAVYRGYPVLSSRFGPTLLVMKPLEMVVVDALVRPDRVEGLKAVASMFVVADPKDPVELETAIAGHVQAERLGVGPRALRSTELGTYPEMVERETERLGWDVGEYVAYRLRVEFPVYLSTVRLRFEKP